MALALAPLVAVACGHPDPDGLFARPGGVERASTERATGDFGSIKGLCRPANGAPPPAPAETRGVTDDAIKIGVQHDENNPFMAGLGARFPKVAEAFADWCNAAGGINGRKIELAKLDGRITEAASRVKEACASEFMLVGGGTPFDEQTVVAREECGLGSMPAYAVSEQALRSSRQVVFSGKPLTEANVAIFRLLEPRFGEAYARTALMAFDISSLRAPQERLKRALSQAQVTLTREPTIKVPVTSLRDYVQPMKDTVDTVILPLQAPVALFSAMNDVGFVPQVILDAAGATYSTETAKAVAEVSPPAPYYLATSAYPLDLVDENPALQQMRQLQEQIDGPGTPLNGGDVGALASWILFAQSAGACTEALTVDCVIEKGSSLSTFDAGGLIAPVPLNQPEKNNPCRAIISVSAEGFRYERELTQPTNGDGPFNCDDRNVVSIGG